MKIFFNLDSEKLNEEDALPGSVWQALELFHELPNDNQSMLGLKNDNFVLEIRRVNLFLWEWSIYNTMNNECELSYFSFAKSERIIRDLFKDLKINEIINPKIEKN